MTKPSQAFAPVDKQPLEIELKLALPTSDPAGLEARLLQVPALAQVQARRQPLHSIYFDTPAQALRQNRAALRLRRVQEGAQARWIQTLKTAGTGDSALSQRGEWEQEVPGPELSWNALPPKPWASMDPYGKLFRDLTPCFVTTFDRTAWQVQAGEGAVIEVALDVGHVQSGDKRTPLCELELELKSGPPAALFTLAQQISEHLGLMPDRMSKAERGFALAQDTLWQPVFAKPPVLLPGMSFSEAVPRVLGEMWGQFLANLQALRFSEDPELVHQARVGWRRFKSALRLFRSVVGTANMPSLQVLEPLQMFLGELRDLDVARTEVLPRYTEVFAMEDAQRLQLWQTGVDELTQAARLRRKAVRYALEDLAVGKGFVAVTQWLEELPERLQKAGLEGESQGGEPSKALRRWVRKRIARLHERLEQAQKAPPTPENQHRVRIAAKRLRYAIEVTRPLLPRRASRTLHQQAVSLQSGLGAQRDVAQAVLLCAKLDVDRGVVEFLRGLAAAHNGKT